MHPGWRKLRSPSKRLALAAVLLVAGCSGATSGAASRSSRSTVATSHGRPSRHISYSSADTDASWGPPTNVVTIGVAIADRGSEDVRIDSFDVIEAQGVSAKPTLMVGVPRVSGSISAAVGFPPAAAEHWPPSSVHALRFPIEIRAGTDLAKWGPEVLIRVERREGSPFGHVKGFRVRGTEGGRPFEDVVRTFLGLCWSGTDAGCANYAREHGYAPGPPLSTPPSSTAT